MSFSRTKSSLTRNRSSDAMHANALLMSSRSLLRATPAARRRAPVALCTSSGSSFLRPFRYPCIHSGQSGFFHQSAKHVPPSSAKESRAANPTLPLCEATDRLAIVGVRPVPCSPFSFCYLLIFLFAFLLNKKFLFFFLVFLSNLFYCWH